MFKIDPNIPKTYHKRHLIDACLMILVTWGLSAGIVFWYWPLTMYQISWWLMGIPVFYSIAELRIYIFGTDSRDEFYIWEMIFTKVLNRNQEGISLGAVLKTYSFLAQIILGISCLCFSYL